MKLLGRISKFKVAIVLLCMVWLTPSIGYGQVVLRGAASASFSGGDDITHVGAGDRARRNNCGNINPSILAGVPGDLLIALVNVREKDAVVTMSGWNLAYSDAFPGQDFQVFVYWRIATGSDPSTINQSGSCSSIGAQIARFRGVDITQPFENMPIPDSNVVRQNSGNLDSGTETTTLDRSMLLVAGFINDNRKVREGAGWIRSFDSSINVNRDLAISLHYQLQTNAGPASVSNWDLSNRGRDENYGIIMALRPAAATAGLTIAVPAGTVVNDVMIASIAVRPCSNRSGRNCTLTVLPPAGWILVSAYDQTTGGGTGGFGNRLFTYLRVASVSEPIDYTWQFGGTPGQSGAIGGILSFSGVDPGNPIVAQAGQATPRSYGHDAPSIDVGVVANTMLVSTHVVNSSATWTPPAGMTEAVEISSLPVPNALGIAMQINYQPQLSPGSTGPRRAIHSNPPASDTGTTQMLALRPINVAIPGSFNAFESIIPAGAITGKLFTKLVGASFVLDIVAINNGVQLSSFNEAVLIDLVANTTGAAIDSNNCPVVFSQIQTIAPNPIIGGGRATVGFPALVNAYRDVRVRVRYPASSPTVISCSADNFAIRPTGLIVSSTNAIQTGASDGPVIKTGANFNLTASSAIGYDGTPMIDNTKITGTPVAGTIGGNFNAALAATGIAAGNSFFYAEVGNFGLDRHAVFDANFTAVDQPNDCTADFSNLLVGGKYGCSFGSSAIPQITGSSGFGRFIPDNFAVSLNTPQFQTTCGAGTFTYIGQPFTYLTAPVITITARNGTSNGLSNATTRNYAGAYMKLSNASLTPISQAVRYSRFDALGGGLTPILDTSVLPATSGDPAIGTFTNGVGTLVFSSGGTGLTFTRNSTPNAPFNADIALAINIIDADGVIFTGNPASFGTATAGNGIAFNNGNEMRFGRLYLQNAFGSELLPLPVPVTAQYWNGIGFVTNTLDQCTQISVANIGLANYTGNLVQGDTTVSTGAAFTSGVGQLTLFAPGVANNGSVDLVVNLGATASEASCIPLIPDPVTTGVDNSYLKGRWCGANIDKDPTARATFGVYKSADEIIYIRELY